MRFIRLLGVAALPAAFLLAATAAQATTQTGQLLVTVQNAEGNAVAGATLVLTGEHLIGGEHQATAEADGTYRFVQLPPGKYTVRARHEGMREVQASGIVVRIGHTTDIDLTLSPEAAEAGVEEIVVTGSVPVVDTERMTLGASITDSFVETVPTGRNYQTISLMVPGVLDAGTAPGNPNVLGSGAYGNQYLLDGINITDPVTNTFASNFNFDAIQEVEVLTGGRDAEYGSAIGGIINIVTKGGSNEFYADASVYYQDDNMQVKEAGEEDLDNRTLQTNINLGGPIIQDKLWYFVSAEVPWSRSTVPTPEGGNVFPDQKGKHPARQFLGFYGLGKLTWQATEDTVVKLLLQSDPALIENTLQDPSVHPDAERQQYQHGYLIAAMAETYLSASLFWKTSLSWQDGGLDIHPQSEDYDTPGRTNVDTGTSTVNDTLWYEDTRRRLQFHTSLSYNLYDAFGDHQFKVGIDAAYTQNKVFDSYPGRGYYTDNGDDPSDPNSISGAGWPYQYTRLVEAQDTRIWGDTESFFVQDIWKPVPNLTIRPGLRFDSARMRNWEDEVQVQLNTISPRFGVAWDPWDDGKTVFRGGYYQYIDTGFLMLSDFAGGKGAETRTYEYNPITEEYDSFVSESGGASGVVGKDYLKDAWNQQRPRVHEFILGGSRELMENVGLGVNFTYRYYANQWEDDEVNVLWNDAGDGAIGFRNGESRFIYSLGAMKEAFIRYWGVEVLLNKAFSDNWEMMASYTYSHTQGTQEQIISVAFDRPRTREYEFGYLPQDRRHVLKIFGSYRLPYGILVGGRVQYLSGAPYNRLHYNSFYGDYEEFRAPRGQEYDEEGNLKDLRLPDIFTVNVRVMWQLEQLIGQRIDLIFEAFNLFNARTVTAVEERNLPAGGGTQFGDAINKLDPLNFQVGLRYRY